MIARRGTKVRLSKTNGNLALSHIRAKRNQRIAVVAQQCLYFHTGYLFRCSHAQGDTLISIENVQGSNFGDRLEGTDGQNWLYGNGGDDVLSGRDGIDVLSGGLGADGLHGGLGDDWMYGNEGNDSLYGEAGNDWLQGGAGADQYVFNASVSGKDVIADFDVTADHLVLAPNLNGNGINTAAQALAHIHPGADGYAALDLGSGNTVTFQGVTAAQLGTEDIVISSAAT